MSTNLPVHAVIMVSRATRLLLLLVFLVFASLLAVADASAVGDTSSPSFVLAGERTRRKDPLDGFNLYAGGWNISDDHYWASVGFTAAPIFAAAGIWFAVFGVALFLAGCCFCCCSGRGGGGSYSCTALTVSLVLLLAFTAAAAVGCAVLYNGQGRFHGSTAATVDYVESQSGDAVVSLRGFASSMEAAKAAGMGPVMLPADVKRRIDDAVSKVSSAADELATRTASNAAKIRAALETIRKVLIVVAVMMLILAVLGLVLSACGLESLVYVLVFLGWIMVAATFLLCGTFLLLHNVVGDTCAAMGEWVAHPQARTALDDILPCVDTAAAADALARSKEVTYQLVAVLNGVISNVSNADLPPQAAPLYYNQSGPPVPLLCSPYAPDLSSSRGCAPGEVDLAGAPRAWREHVCRTHAAASSGWVVAGGVVRHDWPRHAGDVRADGRHGERQRRAVPLRAGPRRHGRLHVRPPRVPGHRRGPLPRAQQVQRAGVPWLARRRRRRAAVGGAVGGALEGEAAEERRHGAQSLVAAPLSRGGRSPLEEPANALLHMNIFKNLFLI